MKKMRLHLGILLGLFLITFILGSIFDQQLSEAIFRKNDNFGLTVSCIGTLLGYSSLALFGGILFGLAFVRPYKVVVKVFLYIGAAAGFGLGLFFAGREFFGPNGFTNESLEWLGYIISLPFMCGVGLLGYFTAKRNDSKYLLNVVIVLMVAVFFSLIPGVTMLKSIFHRPRYRTLSDPLFTEITFHNWWQRCANYEDLMALYNVSKEEFKSFPSGHAGATLLLSLTAAFAPLLDKRIQKNHLVLFYSGLVITLLVCYARMLVGAHFLSDVSMGALLTAIFTFIANEVIIFFKAKYDAKYESQPVQQE